MDSAEESLKIILAVLEGQPGPASDIVALNAGAAIYAANLVDSLAVGVDKAREILVSGAGRRKLEELVVVSKAFE